MEEQYVSLETAKMLKEAGFDGKCRAYYHCKEDGRNRLYISLGCTNDDLAYNVLTNFQYEYLAPTQALAARWLREKYDIHVSSDIYTDYSTDADGNTVEEWTFWDYVIYSSRSGNKIIIGNERYDTYEQAMEAGLQEAIKMIKI